MGAPTHEVRWSDSAFSDLEGILDPIAAERPITAAEVSDRIRAAASRLETMPRQGRVVPELHGSGTKTVRELIVTPWRILYEIRGREVRVGAVLDGRRDATVLRLDRLMRRS
jgi:toxin ParE1/3/4